MTNKRILYVEDNAVLLRMVTEILRNEGYEVIGANNGLKGVNLAAQEHPDLVLMDINLPLLGGLDAARQIKALPGYKNIPIIAMTAGSFEEDSGNLLEAGCDGCLFKPFDPEQLIDVVQRFAGSAQSQV